MVTVRFSFVFDSFVIGIIIIIYLSSDGNAPVSSSMTSSAVNKDKSTIHPIRTSSCNAIVPFPVVLKPVVHQDEAQYNEYNHTPTLRLPEDTKPVHLSHDTSEPVNVGGTLSISQHLKAPTPRSFHMDMRFNPYSRPPYSLNSVPSGFMPAHAHGHGHVYPACSIPQAVFSGYQGSQAGYPSFAGSQGYGYPTGISTPSMVGNLPTETHTSSELHNLDVQATDYRGPPQ
jgi:hypothetical protein